MALILVVEDDAQVRTVIEEALKARGFEVQSVANDTTAYQFLAQEADNIAVLVTDLNLGRGTTGSDIARRALTLNPAMGVVYCTGEDTDIGRFKLRGGIVCRKPVPVAVLGDMVAALAQGDPA